ncbi:hypothetical protein [Sandaracinus amylolyticus]|uniref:bestrophin-like domain n=1 Tax=Sandaracinus amylolyticus TaxID=927083 RepID=UPI001F189F64|nr:hypothetical protein [Sandaracinus amylolyticus]UJR83011.1 Hypothetical protein I5071_50760 [Sandaracinus amylolyticus]
MTEGWSDGAPSWWILLLIASAALFLVTEVGFRIARRYSLGESKSALAGQAAAVLAALLGLLGLLLAFSFNIVEARYAERKRLVLDEANAIGTAYLRAALLPAPHDERARELLRRYVETRTPATVDELDAALARSQDLHDDLWTEAVAAARLDPRSESTALFVDALNAVIDRHEDRVTVALHQHLPPPIIATLIGVAVLGMGVLGYGAGMTGVRAAAPALALALAVSTVMVVIVELDRPGGVFRVSQSAILDTRDAMHRDADVARERVTSGTGPPAK